MSKFHLPCLYNELQKGTHSVSYPFRHTMLRLFAFEHLAHVSYSVLHISYSALNSILLIWLAVRINYTAVVASKSKLLFTKNWRFSSFFPLQITFLENFVFLFSNFTLLYLGNSSRLRSGLIFSQILSNFGIRS